MPQLRLALVVAVATAALATAPTGAAATLPPGFSDQLVATVGPPTALAFTPDGRLLVTTQAGQLRVVRHGILVSTPALNLANVICANSERGLLGIAVDPLFASNRFVYLYYTWKKFGTCPSNTSTAPVNRVSRFVLGDNDVVAPATELVLIDNIHSPNGNHNGGDLNFGKDGNLYVTVGDGGCDYAGGGCAGTNDASRDRNVLLGKVLRITRDGAIPAGNPFTGAGTARCSTTGSTTPGQICQETYAWGLRNPFRFAFDPNAAGTRWFVNDVGQNIWEEIDEGVAGADYGWNLREGPCVNGSATSCGPPPSGLTNPIYAYDHSSSGCASITGGAFVPNGLWPSGYDGKYLFADYVCGSIFRLDPSATGGYVRTAFVTGLGGSSAVHMAFGPSPSGQSLYYTTYAGGGQVRRISHNGTPTASLLAAPTSGSAPLAVSFDGRGSTDPNGDSLTYLWDFGDGATAETTTPTTSHTYTATGAYTASLRVRDPGGLTSAPATVGIGVGNTPPTPTMVSPAPGATFAVGQTITLQGSATDAQDGPLPSSALRWEVLRHHGSHNHPWFSGIGTTFTFAAPAPEDLAATGNSFLEVRLTATDSGGLSTTLSRMVQPRKVSITLATQPSGLNLQVNGATVRGPTTITSWQGWTLALNAPSPQGKESFRSWSDGGAQSHTIVTPASATTYTARFKRGKG
jgi:glucose/arabinose dehydrogenase